MLLDPRYETQDSDEELRLGAESRHLDGRFAYIV
jgi:hypothetical protein